ncbi:MAG: hypothetical protein PW843_24285 [Azospirillaceae bacterium]|nr:hypothetical protein [Azospirillaceae bacterium]
MTGRHTPPAWRSATARRRRFTPAARARAFACLLTMTGVVISPTPRPRRRGFITRLIAALF